MTPTLSEQTARVGIYEIARQMAELLILAESAESPDELAAIETALVGYIDFTEVAKVDNIARSIKHLQSNVGTSTKPGRIDEEIERLRGMKAVQSRILDFLKGTTLKVMEMGSRDKLTSPSNTLRIQNNSQPSVHITHPELVSDEFVKVELTCTLDQWKQMDAENVVLDYGLKRGRQDFDLTALREEIEAGRTVSGAHLERGKHLRVA